MSKHIGRPTNVTNLLEYKSVRHEWLRHFPRSHDYFRALNRSLPHRLRISLCPWARDGHHQGNLGTTVDYLCGFTRTSFDSWARPILSRATLSVAGDSRLLKVIMIIQELWNRRIKKRTSYDSLFRDGDFIRTCSLLAHYEAMYRSQYVEPYEWMYDINDAVELLRALRRQYPSQYVCELRILSKAFDNEIPQGKRVIYNPGFGMPIGRDILRADGDLLIDDLLLELKVSIEPGVRTQYAWQLLSYTALDVMQRRYRIKRIGVYNPRYGAFWSESLQAVIAGMGGRDQDEFFQWFKSRIGPLIKGAMKEFRT